MSKMINNDYIASLMDRNVEDVKSAHVVLDRVLGVTSNAFSGAEIRINEEQQLFIVQLTDEIGINISLNYKIAGVNIMVGSKNDIFARININAHETVDEVYGKFPDADLRKRVHSYFDAISNMDYVSPIPEPVNVPDVPVDETPQQEDDDTTEIHLG